MSQAFFWMSPIGMNGQCKAIKDHVAENLGTFKIVRNWYTYDDPLGAHFREHDSPDIVLGEFHVNYDTAKEIGKTLIHEAAHHLYAVGENHAEHLANECIKDAI